MTWDSIVSLFEDRSFQIVAAIVAGVCGGFCGLVALLNHSLSVRERWRQMRSDHVRSPKARRKTVKSFAIVLNGNADYAPQIRAGFTYTLDQILSKTRYAPVFEEVVGAAEVDSEAANREKFSALLDRFPDRKVDYLVTIGTQVSVFAHATYLNKLPLVFVGVGFPERSGLVPDHDGGDGRGNIAGVTYGLDTKSRMEFLSQLLRRQSGRQRRIGFICNSNYAQDRHIADRVRAIAEANFERTDVRFEIINVTTASLTRQQESLADLFFGYYYLHTHMKSFLASTQKPIVGLNIQDARKGAVASTGNDDYYLGVLAAREIVARNLLQHVALHDMPVIRPNSAYFVINQTSARNHGLTVSKQALRLAHEIIED